MHASKGTTLKGKFRGLGSAEGFSGDWPGTKQLERVFRTINRNGTHPISLIEMRKALKDIGFDTATDGTIKRIFSEARRPIPDEFELDDFLLLFCSLNRENLQSRCQTAVDKTTISFSECLMPLTGKSRKAFFRKLELSTSDLSATLQTTLRNLPEAFTWIDICSNDPSLPLAIISNELRFPATLAQSVLSSRRPTSGFYEDLGKHVAHVAFPVLVLENLPVIQNTKKPGQLDLPSVKAYLRNRPHLHRELVHFILAGKQLLITLRNESKPIAGASSTPAQSSRHTTVVPMDLLESAAASDKANAEAIIGAAKEDLERVFSEVKAGATGTRPPTSSEQTAAVMAAMAAHNWALVVKSREWQGAVESGVEAGPDDRHSRHVFDLSRILGQAVDSAGETSAALDALCSRLSFEQPESSRNEDPVEEIQPIAAGTGTGREDSHSGLDSSGTTADTPQSSMRQSFGRTRAARLPTVAGTATGTVVSPSTASPATATTIPELKLPNVPGENSAAEDEEKDKSKPDSSHNTAVVSPEAVHPTHTHAHAHAQPPQLPAPGAGTLETMRENAEDYQEILGSIRQWGNELSPLLQHCSTLETLYQKKQGEQTNRTLYLLTCLTASLAPLQIMTGLYGTNFSNVPEYKDPNGYYYFIGGCGAYLFFVAIWFMRQLHVF